MTKHNPSPRAEKWRGFRVPDFHKTKTGTKMSSAQRDMFNMDQLQLEDQLLAQGSALSAGSLTTMDAWKEATGFTGGTFEQAKELFGRMTREQQRKVIGSMIRAAEGKTVTDTGKWAALVNSVKPAQ